ncbi:MAG: endolytic transglycosylase MltG, partial [Clostridia bacterium]|nr:endolytic transglycosylase MltG [Clostridia bacterium]
KFSFLKEIDTHDAFSKLEGCLFPDTYKFYKNIEAGKVIKKFLNNFEKKIFSSETLDNDANNANIKVQAEKKGIAFKDLITIASIIQAEAANEDDMYNVSSVIHNRLSTAKSSGKSPFGDGGLLKMEMDCTIYYPYKSKEKVPEDIKNNFRSRYNTYDVEGLPIGPICNPGLVAIDAAINPNNTQFYYFCHDKDKKPYYARTLSEHQANLKKAKLKN